jgi:hypothetical protein
MMSLFFQAFEDTKKISNDLNLESLIAKISKIQVVLRNLQKCRKIEIFPQKLSEL